MINSALEQAERRKKIATADPTIANELNVLLAKIEPLELAQILNVGLDLAEELKDSLPTTSNDTEEPSQVLEDIEATMDLREPSQIIEDIHGTLQHISAKIEEHRVRIRCCWRLLESVGNFIRVLEFRLGTVDKEREENIIREQEKAPMSKGDEMHRILKV
ncbi:hypothetical protein MKW92_015895 [Papaver armeniacum]|nr:hypothetical protein MKW92_015895 [Papaver armeniacum]